MIARQLITTNLQSSTWRALQLASSNISTAPLNRDDDEPEKPVRQLKQWRTLQPREQSLFSPTEYPSKGKPLKMLPRPTRLAPIEIKQWWYKTAVNFLKRDQRFIVDRHQTLGCDLAAAQFLVHRDGKVKFLGKDKWFQKVNGMCTELPTLYDPYWQLTHIDASGLELYYEGLENFINLGQVKWASFKGNPYFNSWCLDKIVSNMPKVEYLDLSECPLLTEIGIGALYRCYDLKTLIVTDWEKKPSFELTCVMLEDLNPQLAITINEPEKDEKKLKRKT